VLNFIKRSMSLAAQSEAFEKFVSLVEHVGGQRSGLLRVLTYHRVDEPAARPWLDPSLISATPEVFDEQMRYLSNNYNLVTTTDILASLETRNSNDLPARAVAVTFDDGYFDFEEHAWPILKRYRIPVTLFVPTAYPDQPERTFWWDDLYHAIQITSRKDNLNTPIGLLSLSNASRGQTYKRLKIYIKTLKHAEAISTVRQFCSELGVQPTTNCILGWDSLRRLTSEGVVLGAHTRTHPLMNRVTLEEAQDEAIGSSQDLERELGSTLPIFAYPSGAYNDKVAIMLNNVGFKLAFTTSRGINNIQRADPLLMRRINVGGKTTLPILRAQLLPWAMHLNWLQPFISA
jgi:peptidoglycan/xylan/chitin deacetylase (PgdA/CDA1 family)